MAVQIFGYAFILVILFLLIKGISDINKRFNDSSKIRVLDIFWDSRGNRYMVFSITEFGIIMIDDYDQLWDFDKDNFCKMIAEGKYKLQMV